ncbi:DUF3375 family protein [Thauera mechernichensis]|uniref:DUF3375 family protein n=1 Tax=Thauera mechernichensis TaxID=82788 RepID=A0ABW3WI72_9RHOO
MGKRSSRSASASSARPKPTIDYLSDWAAANRGWRCKYYKPDTDEAQFAPTPATEKALAGLAWLRERQLVGARRPFAAG